MQHLERRRYSKLWNEQRAALNENQNQANVCQGATNHTGYCCSQGHRMW